MPRINQHGLNLRKKSAVHASIIDEKTGRRKNQASDSIILRTKKKGENWGSNGETVRYLDVEKIKTDVVFLKNKQNPNILILGPGIGEEIIFLNALLKYKKPNIDALGLTNQLSGTANLIIRDYYSSETKKSSKNLIEYLKSIFYKKKDTNAFLTKNLFEHKNHLNLIKKYDYIYSRLGPVTHTLQTEIAILKIASMLRPGGFARIIPKVPDTIISNCKEYLKIVGINNEIDFAISDGTLLIKRLK